MRFLETSRLRAQARPRLAGAHGIVLQADLLLAEQVHQGEQRIPVRGMAALVVPQQVHGVAALPGPQPGRLDFGGSRPGL